MYRLNDAACKGGVPPVGPVATAGGTDRLASGHCTNVCALVHSPSSNESPEPRTGCPPSFPPPSAASPAWRGFRKFDCFRMSKRNPSPTTDGEPITLRTVAEAAGVSVSTASRAINGQARQYRISRRTEQAVQRVAAELGFRASSVARSLRLRRSGLIGVVVPNLSNPFFASIARQFALGVESRGFSVLLGDSRDETDMERQLVVELRSRQIEGLLVCPVGLESGHLIQMDQNGLPVVVVDRAFEDGCLQSVTSDNEAAAERIVAKLLRHGHRHIGVLSGIRQSFPARARLRGYQSALRQAGLDADPRYVVGNAFDEPTGYDGTKQLLQRFPQITALFAMCSPAAIGSLHAAAELGLTVPHDVSLVSFDDEPHASLMQTPLTTVVQDVAMLGQRAAEVLVRRLREEKEKQNDPTGDAAAPSAAGRTSPILVPTQLVERTSIGPPRSD